MEDHDKSGISQRYCKGRSEFKPRWSGNWKITRQHTQGLFKVLILLLCKYK